jgi:hypothetical protein
MSEHLSASYIAISDLTEGERCAIGVGEIVAIHIRINHSPFREFGKPDLVDNVAVVVVLVLRHAGDIAGCQVGRDEKLEGEDAMKSAVEGRGDVLRVLPKTDSVDVLRVFLLIVVRNMRGDEGGDTESLVPRGGGTEADRVEVEVATDLGGTEGVLDNLHREGGRVRKIRAGLAECVAAVFKTFASCRDGDVVVVEGVVEHDVTDEGHQTEDGEGVAENVE